MNFNVRVGSAAGFGRFEPSCTTGRMHMQPSICTERRSSSRNIQYIPAQRSRLDRFRIILDSGRGACSPRSRSYTYDRGSNCGAGQRVNMLVLGLLALLAVLLILL